MLGTRNSDSSPSGIDRARKLFRIHQPQVDESSVSDDSSTEPPLANIPRTPEETVLRLLRTNSKRIPLSEYRQESTEGEDLSVDDVFFALQSERRRLVLLYLSESPESVRMRDVVEQVAAWQHDTTLEALHTDERQRVYISLYQSHLPKLDEIGVINYNQSRGIIKKTEHVDRILRILEAVCHAYGGEQTIQNSDSGQEADLSVSGVSSRGRIFGVVTLFYVVLLGTVWTGVSQIGGLLGIGLSALLSVIIVGVTLGLLTSPG